MTYKIRNNPSAVRIQEAIKQVDRAGKPPDVWYRETLLAAWVATSLEAAYLSHHPEITMPAIIRCERMASGHVDWVSKFPLYCAELLQEMPADLPERTT